MFFDAISRFFGFDREQPRGNGRAPSRPMNCRRNGFRWLVITNRYRLGFVKSVAPIIRAGKHGVPNHTRITPPKNLTATFVMADYRPRNDPRKNGIANDPHKHLLAIDMMAAEKV